jgi:hypothetical protein
MILTLGFLNIEHPRNNNQWRVADEVIRDLLDISVFSLHC